MASIVVSTAPMTEAKPLTAHAHATYSRSNDVSPATARSPTGMNAPRQRPSGLSSRKATTTRSASGSSNRASVTGFRPNR
jgi:hypothetical protein